ncbi:MAG: GerMN domain-containing protein [Candidatus Nealsonbacteria bacterium]|nr:GerMN domain-containing protein [Candidatus Nealsonbacteria bacterium]
MIKEFKKGISLPIIIVISALVLIGGVFIYYFLIKNPGSSIPAEETLIKVGSPYSDQEIQSPFIIKGEARGYWFFEATFPIKLLDENGNIIKQTIAQAQGEWMTEDFVPFEALLTFSVSKSQKGTLVFKKDNPSGLPENDDEIKIPVFLSAAEIQTNFSGTGNLVKDNPGLKPGAWYLVYEKSGAPALTAEIKFNEDSLCQIGAVSQSCQQTLLEAGYRAEVTGWEINGILIVKNMVIQKTSEQLKTVKLYYYNSNLDKDGTGNIICSRNGLVAVERGIPITNTPIQDTIKLLISGNLTSAEKAQGIDTEYPLQGLKLTAASLNGGVLTLTFDDPYNKTGGGSCRVGILWFQIEATAKQFPGVSSVRFMPEELFQP